MNSMIPSKLELRKLAKLRLEEAEILFDNEKFDGANYLAGYVVELALKARICKVLKRDYYPVSGYSEVSRALKTHYSDHLILLAGLEKELEQKKYDDREFATNWSLATDWHPELRYQRSGRNNKQVARDKIDALDHQAHGVFTWIKQKW